MDWKQIEIEWGAMARRCRADVHCERGGDSEAIPRQVSKAEVAKSIVVKRITAENAEAAQIREPASIY